MVKGYLVTEQYRRLRPVPHSRRQRMLVVRDRHGAIVARLGSAVPMAELSARRIARAVAIATDAARVLRARRLDSGRVAVVVDGHEGHRLRRRQRPLGRWSVPGPVVPIL